MASLWDWITSPFETFHTVFNTIGSPLNTVGTALKADTPQNNQAGITGSKAHTGASAFDLEKLYQLEQKAVADANAFQLDMFNKQATFNAEQAALNRQAQIASAREAMSFEAAEAEKLRQWQEVQNQKAMDYNTEMSNTAYQRAVADLKAAGLNPILAYSRGASTPSGVTSSGSSASGKTISGSSASVSAPSGFKANYVVEQKNQLDLVSDLVNAGLRAASLIFLKR